jgi:hypothetical protein
MNIAQRLGGPTLTTLCAVFLAAMLGRGETGAGANAWMWAFLLLAGLHALTGLAAMALPSRRRSELR